jgi:hypothetical protein
MGTNFTFIGRVSGERVTSGVTVEEFDANRIAD